MQRLFLGLAILFLLVVALASCGGGGTGSGAPTPPSSSTLSISGNVTSGGFPLSDVTVTVSGVASATSKTDSNGNYILNNLSDGVYTVNASKSGYTSNPSNINQTISGSNMSNVNFTASLQPNTTMLPLKDAAWSLNPSGGQPTTISWVNRKGVTVQSYAYSGEVVIIVDPTKITTSDIHNLVLQHGGTIFAKLPALGLYWANTSPGSETSLIAALQGEFIKITPNLVTDNRQIAPPTPSSPLPLNYNESAGTAPPKTVSSGNLVFDDFTVEMCFYNCKDGPYVYLQKDANGRVELDSNGNFIETTDINKALSHGEIVDYYRTNKYELYQNDTTLSQSTANADDKPETLNIASLINGAASIGEQAVINYSRGPTEYGAGLKRIGGWETHNQANSFGNLEEFSALLGADVSGTRNTIIVQAAGNSGTDLTSNLIEQQTLHPTASKQILQVGALDDTGIAQYSSYSTVAGTMIYVNVTDVSNQGTPLTGTSFAAPQLQYLVTQIMKNRTDLTVDQLRQVLFNPQVAPLQTVQRPNAPIGETITIPVIGYPLDPDVLQTAVGVANQLFPPSPQQCTYSYTNWSACEPNNTQSRTVTSSSPPGCIGDPVGTVIYQTCTPPPPSCSDPNPCTPGTYMSCSGGVQQCSASCAWGPCVDVCGDGICDTTIAGENETNCPSDCQPVCGDGVCSPGEEISCPTDCQLNSCCVSTNNCPSETPYECGAGCCCCGYGSVCNASQVCS